MQADLIVTVGLDAVELQPKPWPYTLPVLALSSTPSLDALVPADPEIGRRSEAAPAGARRMGAGGHRLGRGGGRDVPPGGASTRSTRRATGLSPQRAMEVARAVLPRDTIATCDAGASRLLVVQKWQSYGPREFLTSNGLGSMGYAVPGALGGAAGPSRPAGGGFTGDGGFLMAVAELQTAQRENLPIIVRRVRRPGDRPDPRQAGDQGHPAARRAARRRRLGEAAQGFGADGVAVETEQALGDALAGRARNPARTTVIGARIDPSGYVAQFNALREL